MEGATLSVVWVYSEDGSCLCWDIRTDITPKYFVLQKQPKKMHLDNPLSISSPFGKKKISLLLYKSFIRVGLRSHLRSSGFGAAMPNKAKPQWNETIRNHSWLERQKAASPFTRPRARSEGMQTGFGPKAIDQHQLVSDEKTICGVQIEFFSSLNVSKALFEQSRWHAAKTFI